MMNHPGYRGCGGTETGKPEPAEQMSWLIADDDEIPGSPKFPVDLCCSYPEVATETGRLLSLRSIFYWGKRFIYRGSSSDRPSGMDDSCDQSHAFGRLQIQL